MSVSSSDRRSGKDGVDVDELEGAKVEFKTSDGEREVVELD